MARRCDEDNLQAIVDTIKINPYQKPGWIARRLGLDNKRVMRALPQLEARGELLGEDEHGRLFWLKRRK